MEYSFRYRDLNKETKVDYLWRQAKPDPQKLTNNGKGYLKDGLGLVCDRECML